MLAIDEFRIRVLSKAASVQSFAKSWQIWKPKIDGYLSDGASGQSIFDFGNHLSEVFLSNQVGGRGQSELSGGGTAWECLVEWYLNFVFWGTPIIAARRNKNHIPTVLLNALSVTISNNSTNSESDIIVFSVPNTGALRSVSLDDVNELISSNTRHADLSVVQCKTNWNDNSQIPMLWDLIYNSSGANRIPNVSVGINGVSPHSFRMFSYAFMTVPTVKKPMKADGVAVLRVKNLTGGNYWGRHSSPSVASSINEYFGRNFATYFSGGIPSHINNQLSLEPSLVRRFKSLDF
jgi:hypothetical protein